MGPFSLFSPVVHTWLTLRSWPRIWLQPRLAPAMLILASCTCTFLLLYSAFFNTTSLIFPPSHCGEWRVGHHWAKFITELWSVERSVDGMKLHTLQRTNTEDLKQLFPEKKLRGHSPNFHIHVSLSDLYCIFPPSICLSFSRKYVDRSLTDTWKWKLGLRPRISQKSVERFFSI